MEMNLQLHHVVSDITGATGMKIIRAALIGNDRAEHVFALAQSVDLYDFYKAKIADCDHRLKEAVTALSVKGGEDPRRNRRSGSKVGRSMHWPLTCGQRSTGCWELTSPRSTASALRWR